MNQLREKSLAADFLAVMTYEKGDPVYSTRNGLIAFLTHDSPEFRIMYSFTYETCFQLKSKLPVGKDVRIRLNFWEDSLKALFIHAEVFHCKVG